MSIERLKIEDIDKKAEEIISKAKTRADIILKEAKKRAKEILERPFPLDEIEIEKEKLSRETEEKIREILDYYQKQADTISLKAKENYDKAVRLVVKLVAGTDE